jgi:hypothetical protein
MEVSNGRRDEKRKNRCGRRREEKGGEGRRKEEKRGERRRREEKGGVTLLYPEVHGDQKTRALLVV